MIKKILLIIFLTTAVLFLVSCQHEKNISEGISTNTSLEVPETGVVKNITDKNGSLITVKPGDQALVNLRGEKNKPYQWSYKDPIFGGYLLLKDHRFIAENDPSLQENEFITQWKMKILKEGEFTLRLHYEDSLKPDVPKKIFRVKVVSSIEVPILKPLYIDNPKEGATMSKEVLLQGYKKRNGLALGIILKNNEGKILSQENIPSGESADEYEFFEKKIKYKIPKDPTAFLEIFYKTAKGAETDKITIPILLK